MANKVKIGRPRADRKQPSAPVEEEILQAARQLFKSKGFASTSTREIASAAGLRQPSLFHYFKNKEDIFRKVALGSVDPVLAFIRTEKLAKHSPGVGLYRLIRFDTYHLCTDKNALGSPFLFPEMTRERMPEFWDGRDQIIAAYRKILRAGVRNGELVVQDIGITTNLLFGLGESTLNWYRQEKQNPSAKKIAETSATLALRSVLADARQILLVQDLAGSQINS